MAMELEGVAADLHRLGLHGYAQVIDAHLTQPAQAVAWRLRIGDSDSWSFCENEWGADFYGKQSGLKYEKQPLVRHICQNQGESQEFLTNTSKTEPATQPAQAEDVGWRDIATAPSGKAILIHYTNALGMGRTIRAQYIERFTEEASPDSDNDEYNEATDTYYTLPGWYEMIDNWDEYSSVFINHDPTHWQPLPTSPAPDKEG